MTNYGMPRLKRLLAEMLMTSKEELKVMIAQGKTDEEIIEQEKEKTRNYREFRQRRFEKEELLEANYGNSYDTALPQDTGVL